MFSLVHVILKYETSYRNFFRKTYNTDSNARIVMYCGTGIERVKSAVFLLF